MFNHDSWVVQLKGGPRDGQSVTRAHEKNVHVRAKGIWFLYRRTSPYEAVYVGPAYPNPQESSMPNYDHPNMFFFMFNNSQKSYIAMLTEGDPLLGLAPGETAVVHRPKTEEVALITVTDANNTGNRLVDPIELIQVVDTSVITERKRKREALVRAENLLREAAANVTLEDLFTRVKGKLSAEDQAFVAEALDLPSEPAAD